nr:ABC transporter substrate-binding protein [uncultured Dysosmobacter sp.]
MNQKNHVRRAALALAGALTLGVLSGCGGAPAKAPQTPDAGESAGYDPVTLDNYGREITISQRPERVLTLGPNCTELFAALGLSDLVVGRSLINHSRGPLPEYADAVNAVPELNYASATREAILSSGADFIYALDWEISDQGCNLEEAAQYGMNVYVNAASTLDQQYQEIRDLGAIFGVEETAEAFVADQQARIAAVQETLADREPVDVLIYDSGNDGVFTCSGVNFESLLVELAGGRNLFGDLSEKQWVTVSYEEVLARDPDVILIHDYDSPSVEAKIAEIQANPTLSRLKCVQEGRFASITLESVLPGNRMAYAVERMAAAFHPDAF